MARDESGEIEKEGGGLTGNGKAKKTLQMVRRNRYSKERMEPIRLLQANHYRTSIGRRLGGAAEVLGLTVRRKPTKIMANKGFKSKKKTAFSDDRLWAAGKVGGR